MSRNADARHRFRGGRMKGVERKEREAKTKDESGLITEEKILSLNGDLKGTLVLPAKGKKFSLVVLQAGSGPTDRNGNSPLGSVGSVNDPASVVSLKSLSNTSTVPPVLLAA